MLWSGYNTSTHTFDIYAISDVLRTAVTPIPGGVSLGWHTHPGNQYQPQRSIDMRVWKNIGLPRTAAGYDDSLDIPGTPSVSGATFYRVIQVR